MRTLLTSRRRLLCVGTLFCGVLASLDWFVIPASTMAQTTLPTGVIVGRVTVDAGEVRAFRVKARDTVRRVSYTVYTMDGAYQIFNLPPSSYDVQVIEAGFDTLVRNVTVGAGQTITADIALTAVGVVRAQGAGARGATAQRNYGGAAADDRAARHDG